MAQVDQVGAAAPGKVAVGQLSLHVGELAPGFDPALVRVVDKQMVPNFYIINLGST